MNDIQDLKNEIEMAVTHAKIDVSHTKEIIAIEPSVDNKEYLRKAERNLWIFMKCSNLMEELYLDKDEP